MGKEVSRERVLACLGMWVGYYAIKAHLAKGALEERLHELALSALVSRIIEVLAGGEIDTERIEYELGNQPPDPDAETIAALSSIWK